MRINDLVKEAYEIAKAHGWHETERSPLEYHALIHSEVSEATEEVRNGAVSVYFTNLTPKNPNGKPQGELIELADVIIRICDYAGSRGWDLEEAIKIKMSFNKTRPHRHGGKKY